MLFLVTSQCMLIKPQKFFCKKKPLEFLFQEKKPFRDEMTIDLLSILGCLQLSKVLLCSKYLSFIDICILHFAVEHTSKVSLHNLWKMVLLVVCNFQNGDQYRMLQTVSIYFLLFYHHNIMLKADIMLDYC